MAHLSRQHIFFSPHFDDAVISCGGLISCLIGADQAVRVVTVFGARPDPHIRSAYTHYLYADWQLPLEIAMEQHPRVAEDLAALQSLGVQQIEHWAEFDEAPFRLDAAQQPLYASYEELCGTLAPDDEPLIETLINCIQAVNAPNTRAQVLYFPLSIGQHVDHQVLFRVGLALRSQGYLVRFYEDWPYVESYSLADAHPQWHGQRVSFPLEAKIKATLYYKSQLRVFGGNSAKLSAQRMIGFAQRFENGQNQERYWMLSPKAAQHRPAPPFCKKPLRPAARDFRRFLKTFRFNHLDQMLPAGSGLCIDAGCGNGRHHSTIEQKGYRWLGLDYTITFAEQTLARPGIQADSQRLPIRDGAAAVLVSWGVIEYLLSPEQAIAEAARVLETGGVFCGYVSFLQPTQGSSLYGMSPLLLQELLRKHGFKDIQVQAGLNGFAIMLWTWLRRWGGAGMGRLAIPLTAAWMVPLAGLRFYASWLNFRLGRGTGHGMRWVTEDSLKEFAGYVTFSARKPARRTAYTSAIPEAGVFLNIK